MIPTFEVKERKFASMSSCAEYLRNESSRQRAVFNKDISVHPDGRAQVRDEGVPLTDTGLTTLLKHLRIPASFFEDVCDAKLGADMVNRLLKGRPDERVRVRITNDGLRSVLPVENLPVSNLELLEVCGEANGELPHGVVLSGRGMRVSLIQQANPKDAVVDDVVNAGWDLENSDDGLGKLGMRAYLFRLRCSNGWVFSERLGGITRYPHAKKPTVGEALEKVRHSATQAWMTKALVTAIEKSKTVSIDGAETTIRERLQREVSEATFQVEFEERIQAKMTYYDVSNTITSYARRLPSGRRRRFERIGASLIEAFIPNGHNGRRDSAPSLLRELWQRVGRHE